MCFLLCCRTCTIYKSTFIDHTKTKINKGIGIIIVWTILSLVDSFERKIIVSI